MENKKPKIKILEITNFSAGICGVYQRVKQEALELEKQGFEVRIFSTNLTKGSEEIAKSEDALGKIKITRFKAKKLAGESYMKWFGLEQAIINYKPNIIIAHSYRHTHTVIASKIAEKLGISSFLVTHAPFTSIQRSLPARLYIKLFHDPFIGKPTLKRFNKIIAITKWEIPFLEKLGVSKDKISYIPNGIPNEFFETKPKIGKNILFLGRISPVKNLELLIKAMKNSQSNLDIVGPAEENYKAKLSQIIKKEKIFNVKFLPAVYDLKKKIHLIDKYEIFILPSKTEAMPQSLIEAMARGKICISSNTDGAKEIIQNKKNGFLFEINNQSQLKEILNQIKTMPEQEKAKIRQEARKSAETFKWSTIIKEYKKIITNN